jgi:hypothetical protein
LSKEIFGPTTRSTKSRGPTPTVQPLPDKVLLFKGNKKKLNEFYYTWQAQHKEMHTFNKWDGSIHIHMTINTNLVGNCIKEEKEGKN